MKVILPEYRYYGPSLTFSFSPLSSFLLPLYSILFLAGDLAQLHLPVGMQDLNLSFTEVTGKAQLRVRRSEGESSLNII